MSGQKDSSLTEGSQDANPVDSSVGGELGSFDPVKFAADLKAELLASIQPEIQKTVQSTKDRRFDTLERSLDDRLKVLDDYEALTGEGLSPADARREMRLRAIESMLTPSGTRGQSDSAVASAKATPESANDPADALSAMLTKLGLTPDDPEVATILRSDGAKVGDAAAGLVGLALQRQSTKPASPPNASAIAAGGGSPPPTGDAKTAALEAQLAEYQKHPSLYRAQIIATEKQLGWRKD